MLYDPKWEVKTKGPSLAGMIAWLDTQPPDQQYDWYDINGCLVCNYLKSLGIAKPLEVQEFGCYSDVVGGMENYHKIGRMHPWTYGAALIRARSLFCADTQPADRN